MSNHSVENQIHTDANGDTWLLRDGSAQHIGHSQGTRNNLQEVEAQIASMCEVDQSIIRAVARSIQNLMLINGDLGIIALGLALAEFEETAE